MKIVGIYKIENIINNKVYIGQSVDIMDRWLGHIESLRKGTHYNDYLQRAWNKYGEDKFIFSIIEECEENKLTDREQYWIDYYGGINSTNNYNNKGASSKGSMSEATKLKLSKSQKGVPKKPGRKVSEAGRKSLSESHKGTKHSEETRKKMSIAQTGRHHTEESKRKISETKKQKFRENPELAKAISKRMSGRKLTDEHKKKIGDLRRGISYKNDIELIKKHSDGLKRAYLTGKKQAVWITVRGVRKMQTEWANILDIAPTSIIYQRRKGDGYVETYIEEMLTKKNIDIDTLS